MPFAAAVFTDRRARLRSAAGDGTLFFPGQRLQPRNYRDNPHPFRQSSHLLYLTGIDLPGLALVMGGDGDVLYGPAADIDDVVWHGPHATLEELAADAGIGEVRDVATLSEHLRGAGTVRWLPPFQHDVIMWMAELLGRDLTAVRSGACLELAKAVAGLRLVKSEGEVAEIEDALAITDRMHRAAMAVGRAGVYESEVAAEIQQIALAADRAQAYNPIVTVHGEVLHNNTYTNCLEDGQLLLNDSGAESPGFYASDITRATPVSGTFTPKQRAIYDTVLRAQMEAITACRPGVHYRDVHLGAARTMTEGLIEEGLMKGDAAAAVAAGAHALFFPHGLGHMLGLDVHDMEDLGDVIGYPGGEARSTQFGLNFLRMARPLEPGNVFTVEPGVYFIPALIDRWRDEGKHTAFIDYDRVDGYRDFGGIRIEDDVLCTEDGCRVLGPGIPKTIAEVEEAAAG